MGWLKFKDLSGNVLYSNKGERYEAEYTPDTVDSEGIPNGRKESVPVATGVNAPFDPDAFRDAVSEAKRRAENE